MGGTTDTHTYREYASLLTITSEGAFFVPLRKRRNDRPVIHAPQVELTQKKGGNTIGNHT